MASIIREISVAQAPETVWFSVREVGNVHQLFAGVVTGCKLEDGARVVTFANGMVVRELIVDVSDEHRRVAYAAVGGRTTHHNASLQVFPDGEKRSRIVWTTDFLPDELAPAIVGLVEAGAAAMTRQLQAPG